MFYDKFYALCVEKKKAPSAVADEIGISRATVTNWKKKPDVIPSGDVIQRVADYFGVSIDTLLDTSFAQRAPAGADEKTEMYFHINNFVNGIKKLELEKGDLDFLMELARRLKRQDGG